jgi:prolyl oligopeptidase
MKIIYLIVVMGIITSACSETSQINYPETRKENVVDTYFGTEVADTYRWLEDDNSAETAAWVEAQNEVTFGYLNQLPERERINSRLTELMDYPRVSAPYKRAGKYFYSKNDGLQNQSVLYMSESLNGPEEILLDPNKLSDDGTIALAGTEITPDGKYLIYRISRSGSDWNEIYVMDIETRQLLPDVFKWVKFAGTAWYDGGFFYSAYPEPQQGSELSRSNENHIVRYHKLGTGNDEDVIIYANPAAPKQTNRAYVTDDRRFLLLAASQGTSGNALFFEDLTKPGKSFIPVMESFEWDFNVIDNIDDYLYILTNYKAPKNRLIRVDTKLPGEENWVDIIPEKSDVLRSANLVGGKISATYMKDAYSHVEIYSYDGTLEYALELPGIGSTGGLSGKKDDNEAFYSFTSYNTPGEVYRYDMNTRETTLHYRPDVKFDPEEFQVDQVWYTSKDGTKIPMFLFYKKGMVKNGANPTLLYGYGGFDISQTPGFSTSRLFFVENGGILAVANLRGGGEYGKEWHEAGTKMKKQNVFDDFIAAAEFLIADKYTTSKKLAIQGGSNGGLLVGAVANQRPELFRVALPAVGVMDMLRYHKFTIGWAWAGDYGTSEDSEEMFKYLLAYSPYHAIRAVAYPATMVTTADHDDRVVPAHSFKYAARLQEFHTGKLPVLIRIETKAGHGAGKPTAKIIEEHTDIWAFTMYHLGMTRK